MASRPGGESHYWRLGLLVAKVLKHWIKAAMEHCWPGLRGELTALLLQLMRLSALKGHC